MFSKITTQMRTLAKKELCQTITFSWGNLGHYFDIKMSRKRKYLSSNFTFKKKSIIFYRVIEFLKDYVNSKRRFEQAPWSAQRWRRRQPPPPPPAAPQFSRPVCYSRIRQKLTSTTECQDDKRSTFFELGETIYGTTWICHRSLRTPFVQNAHHVFRGPLKDQSTYTLTFSPRRRQRRR